MNKSKIIGIILARKGSKRLRNKNLKKIKGKSLSEITINFAKKLKFLKDIVISTDDSRIHNLAKKHNILSPGIRPKNISSSDSTSEASAFYVIKWYEKKYGKVDGILLLQPTSPYRNMSNFNKAFKIFSKKKSSVIGVTEISRHPKNYLLNGVALKNFKTKKKKNFFSFIDGSLYLIPRKIFFKEKTFFPKKFVQINNTKIKYSIDIDFDKDLRLARLLFNENF